MFQVLLVIAISLDAFAASFAYGINKTKIPILSMIEISLICTVSFAISTAIGAAANQIVSVGLANFICFLILFIIGTIKSLEFFLKRYLSKSKTGENHIKLKLFDINFVLTVYADNIRADIDNSKVLSLKEAVYLSLALSLDGFAAGFGYGLTESNSVFIVCFALITHLLAIVLGNIFGKLITKFTKIDFSWIGGIILVVLAFTKLFMR